MDSVERWIGPYLMWAIANVAFCLMGAPRNFLRLGKDESMVAWVFLAGMVACLPGLLRREIPAGSWFALTTVCAVGLLAMSLASFFLPKGFDLRAFMIAYLLGGDPLEVRRRELQRDAEEKEERERSKA